MKKFRLELGSEVKSNITGMKGIVVARSEHLNGCDRYWVQPPMGKDRKVPDGLWMDDQELGVTKKPVLKKDQTDKRGGFSSRIK